MHTSVCAAVNHGDWILLYLSDEFHRMCLEGGYPDVDPGIDGDRVPQQPFGHDGLYPINGNGPIFSELPQIPQVPQIAQIPHILVNGHGNGNGHRPHGPVGEFGVNWWENWQTKVCMKYE